MKILDTSIINDTKRMPIKKGTLQFLQDAYKDAISSCVIAKIQGNSYYSTSIAYVLNGCVNSGVGTGYYISKGIVFYNGEIFDVPETTFSLNSGEVAIYNLVTTQYTSFADPVTFTDTTINNVHNIRTLEIISGVTGSGICDYDFGLVIDFYIPPQLNLTGDAVSGTYPNLVVSKGDNPVQLVGNRYVGNVPTSADTTYSVSFGTTLSSANYSVSVNHVSEGGSFSSAENDILFVIRNKTTTGFDIIASRLVGSTGTTDISFDWVVFKR